MSGLTVLGIETSCDETAAAVVRGNEPGLESGPGDILSNIVWSQIEAHRPYGGVVPEIASRAHLEILDSIIEEALAKAGLALGDVDAIAATAGPGLIGGVMVGLTTAKALALGSGRKLVAVNHLEAHALSPRLSHGVAFPYLLLLISGGHCQLLGVEGVGRFRLYGTTIDDAVGEAFDKAAKILGLPYPGGPAVEVLARDGNEKRYALPRPMLGRTDSQHGLADFSFSGLKTAMRQLVEKGGIDAADACASFQAAVRDILCDRTAAAMAMYARDFPGDTRRLVLAGGVAANRALGTALRALAEQEGFSVTIPPPALCTDNGAMIAWAGIERARLGAFDPLEAGAKARWPLASENFYIGSLAAGSGV